MAFVYRSNTQTINHNNIPGPGYYKYDSQKRCQTMSSAPFNQSSSRQLWKQNIIPGPGTYQLQEQLKKGQRLLQNNGKIYTICQPIIQTSIFKSSSKRFQNNDKNIPGPGQYNIDQVHISSKKDKNISPTNNLYKYLQKMKNQDRQQNQDGMVGELFLGDGDYDYLKKQKKELSLHNNNKKQKKEIPFNSMVKRQVKTRPQTSTGPGSYELIRGKSQKSYNFMDKKYHCSIKKYKKQNVAAKPQLQIDIEHKKNNKEILKVDNLFKKTHNKSKEDCFGSKVSRFMSFQNKNIPGPGNYQLSHTKQIDIAYRKPKRIVNSFGRTINNNKVQHLVLQPYKSYNKNPISKQKQNCKKNEQKKKQSCFGSQQPRFKQSNSYNNNNNSNQGESHMFIGRQKQQSFKKIEYKRYNYITLTKSTKQLNKHEEIDQRPISYATQTNTIFSKNKYKLQLNAPFLSQATRFVQTDHMKPLLAEQPKVITGGCVYDEAAMKDMKRSKGLMESNNPRFKEMVSDVNVSPCSYNAVKPAKKEFNKLFL